MNIGLENYRYLEAMGLSDISVYGRIWSEGELVRNSSLKTLDRVLDTKATAIVSYLWGDGTENQDSAIALEFNDFTVNNLNTLLTDDKLKVIAVISHNDF